MPLFVFLLIALTSCCRAPLSVHTDFLRREKLASFNVDTPDPSLSYPRLGQRLLVDWSLNSCYANYSVLQLEIRIRFGDRSEVTRYATLNQLSGVYIYILEGEEFIQKKGIFTYKVDLIGDNCVLHTWQHQLWKELINVGEKNSDTL